jgi:hypothetical protein
MTVFPQLMVYPVTKREVKRTVVNALRDGSVDLVGDPAAAAVAWEMRAAGMTLAEWESVQALFTGVAGRWRTFTFLDPVGNLLEQSENFAVSPWANGALVSLTTAITDPLGTTRATRVVNGGGAAASVAQTLAVPGTFQYCLSVWAKTTAGSSVTLVQGASTKSFALSSQWSRIFFTGSGVTFAAQLDAGASVDLFGMQVEAQIAPSDYKKTTTRSGVYTKARFADDRLTVTAQGTDIYDAVIRIVNTEN